MYVFYVFYDYVFYDYDYNLFIQFSVCGHLSSFPDFVMVNSASKNIFILVFCCTCARVSLRYRN